MLNRILENNSFGQGKWSVKYASVHDKARYGVCSKSQRLDGLEDTVLISRSTTNQGFDTVSLLVRPDSRKNVPIQIDRIGYDFSRSNWSNEIVSDFNEVWSMPLPTGGVLYTMRDSNFQSLLFQALDQHGSSAQMRISVLRNYDNKLSNQSHFCFFYLDGFWVAWSALQTIMQGAYELIVEDIDLE